MVTETFEASIQHQVAADKRRQKKILLHYHEKVRQAFYFNFLFLGCENLQIMPPQKFSSFFVIFFCLCYYVLFLDMIF